jgi:multiple sugar transport system ATP-binding protein
VLNFGVLQQVGEPDEIYRRPSNRFVAGFVGSPAMNFLPATIGDGRLVSGPFELPTPETNERLGRRQLEMGIRPEHLRVRRDRKGVPATVEVVEAAGNETFLHLRAGEHRLVARVGPDLRPAVGAVLRVEVPAGRAYVFDGESGQTLVQAT